MSWVLIAVISYFIFAIGNIGDKFLLDKYITSSKTYAFLISLFSLAVFLLSPWFLEWPGWTLFFYNVLIGALAPIAMLLMYKALKEGEASQIITIIGATVPIFTLLLSISFLGEHFSGRQWLALSFLVLGAIVFSGIPQAHDLWHKVQAWFSVESINHRLGVASAIAAAFVFALFFIGSKYLYSQQGFMSAFIWLRLGTALVSILILVPAEYRQEIFDGIRKIKSRRVRSFFLVNQLVGGGGFLLQNYAIALGSVAIVNALQGVQYVSLLILTSVMSIFYPRALQEKISRSILRNKLFAIVLIVVGLYLVVS
ncbi:MAG: hypothetical protein C3F02_04895 [Parcubacteria group bacterium]|nr:MAG: hypothetical protein C3F02_04895 [Parcubacteria group bacterium]